MFPHRAETPAEVARIAQAQWQSGLGGGLLVTAPIPPEHALPPERVEAAVSQALAEAAASGVSGPRLTPWLLARVAELTGGESVSANRALLLNNATIAARIAVALVRLSHAEPLWGALLATVARAVLCWQGRVRRAWRNIRGQRL